MVLLHNVKDVFCRLSMDAQLEQERRADLIKLCLWIGHEQDLTIRTPMVQIMYEDSFGQIP